jgi:hypothetical protein
MMPRRQLFFDKLLFSSLENNGREIISQPQTHKVLQTISFINLNCLTYMSSYVFIFFPLVSLFARERKERKRESVVLSELHLLRPPLDCSHF